MMINLITMKINLMKIMINMMTMKINLMTNIKTIMINWMTTMINMKTMMIRSVRGHDDVRMLIFVCFLYQRKFLEILASREMCHLNWLPVIAYDHTLTGLPILL